MLIHWRFVQKKFLSVSKFLVYHLPFLVNFSCIYNWDPEDENMSTVQHIWFAIFSTPRFECLLKCLLKCLLRYLLSSSIFFFLYFDIFLNARFVYQQVRILLNFNLSMIYQFIPPIRSCFHLFIKLSVIFYLFIYFYMYS